MLNYTSAADWQMAVQRDNVISILVRPLLSTFLTRSPTSLSGSYPTALTRLGDPRSRPNPHLKLWMWGVEPTTSRSVVSHANP